MMIHRFTVDYYETLQIRDDADESTIKATYKRLALVKHPDRNPALDATAEFQRVQEAYDVLKDRNLRKYFDAELPRIRRETPNRTAAASNSESNYTFHDQTPQFYEQAVYVQKQAAAHAKAAENYRQQVREGQEAEERAKRQRKEQLRKETAERARKQEEEQMRKEEEEKRKRQLAEAKARKQRERQLKQEMEELERMEKEEQKSRDIQQRMVWEAEVRFAKERHRHTKAEKQRAGFSDMERHNKEVGQVAVAKRCIEMRDN